VSITIFPAYICNKHVINVLITPSKHVHTYRLFLRGRRWRGGVTSRRIGFSEAPPGHSGKSNLLGGGGAHRRNRSSGALHGGVSFEFEYLGEFEYIFETASGYEYRGWWTSFDAKNCVQNRLSMSPLNYSTEVKFKCFSCIL
jgi:hypothetical protein